MPRTTRPVTISLDDPALRKGKRQAKQRGFKQSFSAYVAHLIDRDARELSQPLDPLNGTSGSGRSKEAAHA